MPQHVQRDYAFMDEKVHRCCAHGCLDLTLLGYVACRPHWTALPVNVRQDLASAFRLREQRPELYAEAIAVAKRLVNLAAGDA